ncbi:hypothetical protein CHS0354_012036 [Potamilus streckersoni]|uniref:Uncharacterized protein n=1 Tax=Potamilus streckersoni TaxID=2493646 RepID=A0AAE0TJR6_9BIVA|nr:hypothetical protein CHS0354_012036 [Potamilus streckersoni]
MKETDTSSVSTQINTASKHQSYNDSPVRVYKSTMPASTSRAFSAVKPTWLECTSKSHYMPDELVIKEQGFKHQDNHNRLNIVLAGKRENPT